MIMFKFSLKNPESFYRIEESLENHSYGCEQEWYRSDWQKKSGCGPTTACNLLLGLYILIGFSKVRLRLM